VTAIRGPVRADDGLLREGEAEIGTLRIATDAGVRRVRVGRDAAERGILLGRYARCDSSDLLSDIGVSRTHLLVILVEGTLYGIDTASTCGSYVVRDERLVEFRELALTGAQDVELALVDERVRIRWCESADGRD
jgi:hypothetical protein